MENGLRKIATWFRGPHSRDKSPAKRLTEARIIAGNSGCEWIDQYTVILCGWTLGNLQKKEHIGVAKEFNLPMSRVTELPLMQEIAAKDWGSAPWSSIRTPSISPDRSAVLGGSSDTFHIRPYRDTKVAAKSVNVQYRWPTFVWIGPRQWLTLVYERAVPYGYVIGDVDGNIGNSSLLKLPSEIDNVKNWILLVAGGDSSGHVVIWAWLPGTTLSKPHYLLYLDPATGAELDYELVTVPEFSDYRAYEAVVSPSGNRIAWLAVEGSPTEEGRSTSIFITDIRGKDPRIILTWKPDVYCEYNLRWVPNEKSLSITEATCLPNDPTRGVPFSAKNLGPKRLEHTIVLIDID